MSVCHNAGMSLKVALRNGRKVKRLQVQISPIAFDSRTARGIAESLLLKITRDPTKRSEIGLCLWVSL